MVECVVRAQVAPPAKPGARVGRGAVPLRRKRTEERRAARPKLGPPEATPNSPIGPV